MAASRDYYTMPCEGPNEGDDDSSDSRVRPPYLSVSSLRENANIESESSADDFDFLDDLKVDVTMPSEGKYLILGICAMAKKVQSKPMSAILKRVKRFSHIKIITFEETTILNEDVEMWPIVDALISFYSHGFPLEKAIAYADLRKPYLINDLRSQYILMNRRNVYEVLQKHDIPVVRHALLYRGPDSDPTENRIIEQDDHIDVNGMIFHKPFVEKPVDAENHNIHIYFPSSAGGGSVRLFRKIGDRSSTYHTESRIREYGSYIYEDFMPTDGTDVKVYAIGAEYAHAEARKSPALDGKVERDSEGKEMRCPIILSAKEKIIAKKVVEAFNQNICGFDLLRANGQSYVCDVNGFSFVKSSKKYYDDCASMLCVMVTSAIAPQLSLSIKYPKMDKPPLVRTTFGTVMELRSVIGVIRHGDRTPKQKLKCQVFDDKFFALFEKFRRSPNSLDAKIKKPIGLQELLNIARELLQRIQSNVESHNVKENKAKLEQLKTVLEMYGHFSGINRKAQIKYSPKSCHSDLPSTQHNRNTNEASVKASAANGNLLLIVKWGGELTDEGRRQAEKLGRAFRVIYPGGESYSQKEGLGLLRLHSTYRHDLKIYASDEGRVQTTAAAFAKGFLDLEGSLTPILVQMVKSANTNGLLDSDNDCRKYQQVMKEKINTCMGLKRDWTIQDFKAFGTHESSAIWEAMNIVYNPCETCKIIHGTMQNVYKHLCVLHDDPEWIVTTLYHGETWELAMQRWRQLVKDFMPQPDEFDFTKIPDIYDNIKYDLLHNANILHMPDAKQLYYYAKHMADIVIPSEYGVSKEEKLVIAQRICTPLLKKILVDAKYAINTEDDGTSTRLCADLSLNVTSPERFVRTRLYFTSESHIHSLLSCIRFGGLNDVMTDQQWHRAMQFCDSVPELDYLSQIVFMLYEDPSQSLSSENRYHVELHFSPGTINIESDVASTKSNSHGFRPKTRNLSGVEPMTSSEWGQNSETDLSDPVTPSGVEHSPASDVDCASSGMPKKRFGRFEASTAETNNKYTSTTSLTSHHVADVVITVHHQQPPTSVSAKSLNEKSERNDPLSDDDHSRKRKYLNQFSFSDTCLTETKVFQDDQPTDAKLEDSSAFVNTMSLRSRKNSWSLGTKRQESAPEDTYPFGNSQSQYNTYHGINQLEHTFLRNCLKGSARLHLFSTKVIMGSSGTQCSAVNTSDTSPKTGSPNSPKLELVDPIDEEIEINQDDLESGQTHLTTVPSVPEIYPLETLHNSLTLHQLERFLLRLTQNKLHTPWASPRHSLNLS